jgi:hypothetical protein
VFIIGSITFGRDVTIIVGITDNAPWYAPLGEEEEKEQFVDIHFL